jgi:DNA polymerase-3 subunit gamma/tau
VQLYYQIALSGRRDLAMAPDPRTGFEMTLLRMLAFRPDSAATELPRTAGASSVAAREGRTPGSGAGGTIASAAPSSAPVSAVAAVPVPVAASAAVRAPARIEPASWPQVVEAAGLSGMGRQFALNCVPASFENDVLTLRIDPVAEARRSRQIEDKLVQALGKYLGRELRVIFEVSETVLPTPARQRALADQDKTLRAVAAFQSDPAVKGLQERFGAEVDTSSVKPAN